jgi:hypothetical protein
MTQREIRDTVLARAAGSCGDGASKFGTQYSTDYRRPDAPSLVLGCDAARVKFNVLPAFRGHEEPHSDTPTLD